MRFRLGALAVVLGLAGCGGTDESSKRTLDGFDITFEHRDGTVSPPLHAEWRLRLSREGQATATYVPDYPKPAVPRFSASFRVSEAKRESLYSELKSRGLLAGGGSERADAPVGGDRDTVTVTAGGKRHQSRAGAGGREPLADDFRALIPVATWRSFLERREAYALSRYDRLPPADARLPEFPGVRSERRIVGLSGALASARTEAQRRSVSAGAGRFEFEPMDPGASQHGEALRALRQLAVGFRSQGAARLLRRLGTKLYEAREQIGQAHAGNDQRYPLTYVQLEAISSRFARTRKRLEQELGPPAR